MQLTVEYKQSVRTELLKVREHYTGTDYAFATQWGIGTTAFSLLKNASSFEKGSPLDRAINATKWLSLGRELNIVANKKKWNAARTEVFARIEEEVKFCKDNSKAMMLVDDCEIGKTFTGKYLSKTLDNCFYLDCSQSPAKGEFIRAFAKVIGVEAVGSFANIKANIKYYLRDVLTQPVVILDEAGDLEHKAFLELKEFWNATDGCCGWYVMGADGLRAKIKRGIANEQVGYREILSRYSGKFKKVTPNDKQERIAFYRDLITAVITANCEDKTLIPELVKKCLTTNDNGDLFGLRRAESLILLSNPKPTV